MGCKLRFHRCWSLLKSDLNSITNFIHSISEFKYKPIYYLVGKELKPGSTVGQKQLMSACKTRIVCAIIDFSSNKWTSRLMMHAESQ